MVKFKVKIVLLVRYSWPLPSKESAKVQGKTNMYVHNKIDTNFVCHVLQN
jgi:hypothetical protein